MKNIKSINEFINEENKFRNIIAAGLLLLGSCTYVEIEDKNDKPINNIEFANKIVKGKITQTEYRNKGEYYVEITDNENNKYYTIMQPGDFWCRDEAAVGDSVKMEFDPDGKECKLFKKDSFTPNEFHRVHGGGFAK